MCLKRIVLKYSQNNTSSVVFISTIESPIGKLIVSADNNYLYCIVCEDSKNLEKLFQKLVCELCCKLIVNKNKVLQKFEEELSLYFDGKLIKFTVPFKTFGSEFQQLVWDKLLEVPFGSTQTYGDLAKSLGRSPSHSRAVGAACGANPLLLVIPCHRLIASGSKGGFSCGVDRKQTLLEHETKFV